MNEELDKIIKDSTESLIVKKINNKKTDNYIENYSTSGFINLKYMIIILAILIIIGIVIGYLLAK